MNYAAIATIEDIRSIIGVSGDKLYYLSPDRHFGYIALTDGFKKVVLCTGATEGRLHTHYVHVTLMDPVAPRPRLVIYKSDDADETAPPTRALAVYDAATATHLTTIPGAYSGAALHRQDGELVYSKELMLSGTIYQHNFSTNTTGLIMPGKVGRQTGSIGDLVITDVLTDGFYARDLRAFNLATREMAWELNVREIGKYYTNIEGIADAEHWVWMEGSIDKMIMVDDRIYLLCAVKLVCVNALSGELLWNVDLGDNHQRELFYTDNQLLVYDAWLGLFAWLDPDDGSMIRKSEAAAGYRCGLASVNGERISLTLHNDRKIVVLSREDLSQLAVIDVPVTDYSCGTPAVSYGRYLLQLSSNGLHVWHPDED